MNNRDFLSDALERMAVLYSQEVSLATFGVKQWMEFCGWLARNNILMCLVPLLRKIAPVPVVRKLDEAMQIHERAMWRRLDALKRFASAANSEHLPFMLIKGMTLSQELYGNAFARQSGDIDILVDHDDIPKADYALRKAGWVCPGEAHEVRRMMNDGVQAEGAFAVGCSPYPLRSSRFLPHVTNYFYRHNNGQIDTLELHDRFYALSAEQCAALLAAPELLDIGGFKVPAPSRPAHILLMLLSLHEDVEGIRANVTGRQGNGLKGALDVAVWLQCATDAELAEVDGLASVFGAQPRVSLALDICSAILPGTSKRSLLVRETSTSIWSSAFALRMLNPVAAAESGARDALEALMRACENGVLESAFALEGEWNAVPIFVGKVSAPSGFSFRVLRSGEAVSMAWKVPSAFSSLKDDLALMAVVIGRGQAAQTKAIVVNAACHVGKWEASVIEVGAGNIDVHAGTLRGGRPLEIVDMPDGAGGLKVELSVDADFRPEFTIPSAHMRIYGALYREVVGMTLLESVQKAMGFYDVELPDAVR